MVPGGDAKKTHNFSTNTDSCENLGWPSDSLLPKFRWRHLKLGLASFKGKGMEQLARLLKWLSVCVDAIELSELGLESLNPPKEDS